MSYATRYLVCRLTFWLTATLSLVCLAKTVGPGMSGEIHTVIVWFVFFSVFVATAIYCRVAMAYNKSRIAESQVSATEILAKAGADIRRETEQARREAAERKDPVSQPGPSENKD
jgi:hypothetical protein